MGFFDNLGKKASAAYDATAERTSRIAKEAKLRMKMNENKSDINDLYNKDKIASCYIIALGVNDLLGLKQPLGDITDIDVNN